MKHKMLVLTNISKERVALVDVNDSKLGTSDKIMMAAIELIAERGYNGVSTKEIAAAAGFSEMTLFRHFGSKQNLLEAAVDRHYYTAEMQKLFSEKLTWDLHTDLMLISKTYHRIMNRNRSTMQIIMRDGRNLPGFHEKTRKHPRQLKELLTKYFTDMQKKGKLLPNDAEAMAVSYLVMNHGGFMSNLDASDSFTRVSTEEFIATSVQLFTRALTP